MRDRLKESRAEESSELPRSRTHAIESRTARVSKRHAREEKCGCVRTKVGKEERAAVEYEEESFVVCQTVKQPGRGEFGW